MSDKTEVRLTVRVDRDMADRIRAAAAASSAIGQRSESAIVRAALALYFQQEKPPDVAPGLPLGWGGIRRALGWGRDRR